MFFLSLFSVLVTAHVDAVCGITIFRPLFLGIDEIYDLPVVVSAPSQSTGSIPLNMGFRNNIEMAKNSNLG